MGVRCYTDAERHVLHLLVNIISVGVYTVTKPLEPIRASGRTSATGDRRPFRKSVRAAGVPAGGETASASAARAAAVVALRTQTRGAQVSVQRHCPTCRLLIMQLPYTWRGGALDLTCLRPMETLVRGPAEAMTRSSWTRPKVWKPNDLVGCRCRLSCPSSPFAAAPGMEKRG